MMCLSPLSIPRPNGRGNTDRITVPCSKCAACLSRKRQHWQLRLSQEFKSSSSAYFVTLTYNDENLYFNSHGLASVTKRDVQLFLKRLRKKTKFKYFCVAEYGTRTYRPHYHLLFFNVNLNHLDASNTIAKQWNLGQVHVGTVTSASINYCAKYCITKPLDVQNRDPVFMLCSKGIGVNYVDKLARWHNDDELNRFYAPLEDGKKVSLPRYYQQKIYSEKTLKKRQKLMENEQFDPLPMDEFLKNNPNGNYFKYVQDVKQDYIRRLRVLIDKSQKL